VTSGKERSWEEGKGDVERHGDGRPRIGLLFLLNGIEKWVAHARPCIFHYHRAKSSWQGMLEHMEACAVLSLSLSVRSVWRGTHSQLRRCIHGDPSVVRGTIIASQS